MHLIRQSLERRTFLKGMGASVALPFLDAMVPAGRMSAAAAQTDVTRFVAIEMVHGAAGCNEWGATQHLWAPQDEGPDFDLTPSALSPLEDWREYLTIVSNTDVGGAEAELPREIGGDHFRSSAVFLTQSHPQADRGLRRLRGRRRWISSTPEALRAGDADPVDAAVHRERRPGGRVRLRLRVRLHGHVSWASPTEPLPMIRDPRVAFDQLFGGGRRRKSGRSAARRSAASSTGSCAT